MLTQTLAVAVSALALAAPGHADHASYDCGWQEILRVDNIESPDDYTGLLYGSIAGAPGEAATLRCYISVDGEAVAEVYTTSPGTAAEVETFRAADWQDVDLCTEWTAGADGGTICFELTST